MTRWAILTGEYPPCSGGVADYTQLVAQSLSAAGDDVRVYTSRELSASRTDTAPPVFRLPDHFGLRGLVALNRQLRSNRPDRILVQYVPHAFGHKAMNVAFAAWVQSWAKHIAPIWTMFHEVAFPFEAGQSVRHRVLAGTNQVMAKLIADASERVFVSIPAWRETLRTIAPRAPSAEWLPVPSNIPSTAAGKSVSLIRTRLATDARQIVGHFGSYGEASVCLLRPILVQTLRQMPNAIGLLIGRGSEEFRETLVDELPELSGRIRSTGNVPAAEIAAFISACDLLVQPYPDGVSCRRGSTMAGLAIGRPIVTNQGFLSEDFWGTASPGVTVTESANSESLTRAIVELLRLSPRERSELGTQSADWYRRRFSIEHTIRTLTESTKNAS